MQNYIAWCPRAKIKMAEGALLKVNKMERLPHALIDAIAQRLTERELALGLGLCSTSLQRSQKQILQLSFSAHTPLYNLGRWLSPTSAIVERGEA